MKIDCSSNISELAVFYKTISDPIRLKIIVELLSLDSCVCICNLAKKLDRNQSVIYKHVQILKKEDLINTYKHKNFLMCCIKNKTLCKKILVGFKK